MTIRNIPFARAAIDTEEFKAVQDVLESGWITTGPKVKQFELEFAKYIGVKHACAVSSCTAAMHASLVALGIGANDDVITTVMTFPSTANTIVHCGATPVFCDIDERTCNIDPIKIEHMIVNNYEYNKHTQSLKSIYTNNTLKGITIVHYAGLSCDLFKIREIAKKYNLFILEDVAHAVGASYEGNKTGSLGTLGCFSFYATKNMTTAEGGMITTNDEDLVKKLRLITNHGITKDSWSRYGSSSVWNYDVLLPGYKYNMTDIQAALGLVQLAKIDLMNEARKKLVQLYLTLLDDVPGITSIQGNKFDNHAHHLFPILVDSTVFGINRDTLSNELTKRGIGNSVHFIPLSLQTFFREKFNYKQGDFPVAESIFSSILSLPLSPNLTEDDINFVVSNIKDSML